MTRPDYCPVAQEPCQSMCVFSDVRCKIMREGKDFTISKPWVGLTDEERHDIREWQMIQEKLGPVWAPMMLYLYEAIEVKLREKNGG